ncbi:hypothetical protein EDEG_01270 [Edhazardia aedis USNM 41457]|uniref:Transmembrane protein n=1 Tax=Edhazardia aedis (strain USNM 41457) TaxID=1003232 RepID=J9DT74_EDHAE|nr:hypothetical protein EDEG_01270 [Edhazardia aedis USNM 41457]|eukprot:EJW04502.1 hypothetical protein EDEG_01270 [Edhazardia aedis USNM 41457]
MISQEYLKNSKYVNNLNIKLNTVLRFFRSRFNQQIFNTIFKNLIVFYIEHILFLKLILIEFIKKIILKFASHRLICLSLFLFLQYFLIIGTIYFNYFRPTKKI